MKLKHIHIDKYKVFQNFDIDFCHDDQTQSLIVITGVNGSGKTTLLRDVISGSDAVSKPKGYVTVENNGEVETFSLPVSMDNEDYQKVFSKVIFYKADDKSSVSDLQKEILRYVDKFVYVEGKTSFEAYGKIQALIEDIFSGFNLQVRFKGIDENKQLVFVDLNGQEFGVEGLSGGEQQILSKVFPLFTDSMKGHVILIDEPEDSLHPSWQTRLIPILRRCAQINDCQFILATHSPQIISSVRKEEIRVFKRGDNGYVKLGVCMDSPYGWTVEKVLTEIQGVDYMRVPEVRDGLAELSRLIEEDEYNTDDFRKKLSDMEATIGFTDRDLALIRMEVIRKKKKQ